MPHTDPKEPWLEQIREICLSFPGATERLSHGTAAWYVVDKKQFVIYVNNHHNDARLALWMAAPMGAQAALNGEAHEWFFVPPYVGYRGWIGVRLDRGLTREEAADLIEQAYRAVAPAKLAAGLDSAG